MDVDEEIDVVTNTDDVNGVVASGDEEDDKEYEVEKILKQKRERGKTLFLVRWRGYGPSDDSWEPQENLVDGAQDVLDAFLEEQAQLKKKGVKRLGSENIKTPKRVKSATPLSDVNAEEMSSESEDDEFKVESSSRKKGGGKALNQQKQRRKRSCFIFSKKKSETTSTSSRRFSSSDSRLGVNTSSQSSLQTAVESRVKNNVFHSWLDSDEDDEERLSVDGKNDIKTDNDDKVKDENGDLELKLNTSGNSEDDKNKVNGKIVENGEVDGKGSVRKDNKKDSPPPPTDPEENGDDNSKAKAAISASLRRRSTTVEKTEVKNSVSNNISSKEVSNAKQKKNKNEREVDVDKEKGEKPSSEFRIDVMFRDNVGKLKLVANLGMTSECQITINAQLEKELAMFLKTKIKPGGPRKNKNIVSDDDSDG
uniref:Chromo domain-containing protein n=1 Tax=Meloidogyne enterolobii TaxID=390850 RepID=A0A6V7XGQ0_MELEN|nr:unnamed protein product [Meloidogyne enterolobii]